MSFSDKPTFSDWRYLLGCAIIVLLLIGNAFGLLSWYLTFWDLSTDTYRALTVWDVAFVIGLPATSMLLLKLYYKWALKGRS